MATNKRRVLTAIGRINSAIFHLNFILTERIKPKQYIKRKSLKWAINTTLFELKNAKTLLENTSHKKVTK